MLAILGWPTAESHQAAQIAQGIVATVMPALLCLASMLDPAPLYKACLGACSFAYVACRNALHTIKQLHIRILAQSTQRSHRYSEEA